MCACRRRESPACSAGAWRLAAGRHSGESAGRCCHADGVELLLRPEGAGHVRELLGRLHVGHDHLGQVCVRGLR